LADNLVVAAGGNLVKQDPAQDIEGAACS